jgi:hypothetical protein
LQYKIIGAPKKLKKWPRPLFRPKTNHAYHQKPNPSHETVPLKDCDCNIKEKTVPEPNMKAPPWMYIKTGFRRTAFKKGLLNES